MTEAKWIEVVRPALDMLGLPAKFGVAVYLSPPNAAAIANMIQRMAETLDKASLHNEDVSARLEALAAQAPRSARASHLFGPSWIIIFLAAMGLGLVAAA